VAADLLMLGYGARLRCSADQLTQAALVGSSALSAQMYKPMRELAKNDGHGLKRRGGIRADPRVLRRKRGTGPAARTPARVLQRRIESISLVWVQPGPV